MTATRPTTLLLSMRRWLRTIKQWVFVYKFIDLDDIILK
tara:strand:- start:448 stop:564 length:117 start_codon:yes stop_codon:yes gene_type:complete